MGWEHFSNGGKKKRCRKICLGLRLTFWAVRIQNQQVERKWWWGDSHRVSGDRVCRAGWVLSPWFGWEGKVVASVETGSGTMRKWNDFHFELVRIGCLWASRCWRQFCKTTPTTPLLNSVVHGFYKASISWVLILEASLTHGSFVWAWPNHFALWTWVWSPVNLGRWQFLPYIIHKGIRGHEMKSTCKSDVC